LKWNYVIVRPPLKETLNSVWDKRRSASSELKYTTIMSRVFATKGTLIAADAVTAPSTARLAGKGIVMIVPVRGVKVLVSKFAPDDS
jgi:hypothetical protein